MKTLYYVIEKEFYEDDETLTGLKTVNVYEVSNEKVIRFFDLDLTLEDNTKEHIQYYLDDNGYGDDEFEMIQL